MKSLAEGRPGWAMLWPCVHEFLAIVTHPKIYAPPSTVQEGVDQVQAWLESPSVAVLGEPTDQWRLLEQQLVDGKIAGPMVHDARVVALCIGHGVRELWTADRDFSRFPNLKTVNPLT